MRTVHGKGKKHAIAQTLLAVLLALVTLAVTACGVTGPKVRFAPAGQEVQASGPGAGGSIADSHGVTVASGEIFVNPLAIVADLLELVGKGMGSLFGPKAAAQAPVAAPPPSARAVPIQSSQAIAFDTLSDGEIHGERPQVVRACARSGTRLG